MYGRSLWAGRSPPRCAPWQWPWTSALRTSPCSASRRDCAHALAPSFPPRGVAPTCRWRSWWARTWRWAQARRATRSPWRRWPSWWTGCRPTCCPPRPRTHPPAARRKVRASRDCTYFTQASLCNAGIFRRQGRAEFPAIVFEKHTKRSLSPGPSRKRKWQTKREILIFAK